MLHVLNGDATREKLERSSVPGEFTVWADTLHEGPVPAGLDAAALRELRTSYLAGASGVDEAGIAAMAARWDAGLQRFREHEEVVFWFEHDLFDQLILIRHLHWLSTMVPAGAGQGDVRFSLICIGAFPGVEFFTGLGPLPPEQLATLLPQRVPITHEQIESGRRAWELFRGPDPLQLLEWMGEATPALPYLHGALVRHFEDYPWTSDGLSRSERQMLAAITEGHDTPSSMFLACQRKEERVYMGDSTFFSIMRRLARGRTPLIELAGDRARLTSAGRDVFSGRADHVLLNGIDRWMGGVHLTKQNCWRWDRLTLTRC
jgi:hypothetical protein